jgi:hypothetical protein
VERAKLALRDGAGAHGAANHLCDGSHIVDREEYASLLARYARSQRLAKPDGTTVHWIDENLHPDTGDWISRTRLMSWSNGGWDEAKGGCERGKDYNHSTYCDNVISGLFGIRPGDGCVDINPLLPADWDWAYLGGVPCHGCLVTVLWDRTGQKYRRGSGFRVFVDCMEKVSLQQIGACSINI